MSTTSCLTSLVGLKQLCTAATAPEFYLDDIEGINQERLSMLATANNGSGKQMAVDIIESAARMMLADIEASIPANFMLTKEIVSICSSCSSSSFYSGASIAGTGIVIKNLTKSNFANIFISSLSVKINNTGSFTLKINDGDPDNLRTIIQDFTAGQETIFKVAYTTAKPSVKIYFDDPAVSLAQITCPSNSSCGCGVSNKSKMAQDILVTGLSAGIETTQQYGILPCVMISCNYDAIICQLINASPKIFGLALLYKCATKIFDENSKSTRINRQASFDQEERKTDAERYEDLYRERLFGKPKNRVLGITQVISNNLSLLKDKCITCSTNPIGIAYATG